MKRRLNATEDDGRIAAVAELRSAALDDLDDVYHYITTLQAPNAVPARIREKLLKLWITVRQTNRFWEKRRSNGQDAFCAVTVLWKSFSLRAVPAGLLLAGKSGWAWSG